MRTIKDYLKFRTNVTNHLFILLKNNNIASNLEKGIYNYCIKEATKKNIVKKWDNSYFVTLYTDRLRCVYINLKNEELLNKIINKNILAHEVAFMTHQEMLPHKWDKLLEVKKERDENKYTPKIEASTDNFTCRKCKSKRCTYYQLQTRSADEPMTTFVTCLECTTRWKC
jgi:transcription elongation factor S-II